MTTFTLADLEAIIARRAAGDDPQSYTRTLMARGIAHSAKKLGEEAVETVIAAVAEPSRLVSETADLMFHLLVVLKQADVPFDAVLAELERRTAETGLQEKASRPQH